MSLRSVRSRLVRWLRGRQLPIWYDRRYRPPVPAIPPITSTLGRRADYVLGYLLDHELATAAQIRSAPAIAYDQLALVHSTEWLDSLADPQELAALFGVPPEALQVGEVLQTVRLACGATLAAARESLDQHDHSLNLLGGFRHAGPASGSALSPVNDIATAIAVLRGEGFGDHIVVLDLDAHPPDGITACLAADGATWIGSLSGVDWGPVEGADDTVLPAGAEDGEYLEALAALLDRMPPAGLAFVIAGGDVLAGDHLGALGLTLAGARQRDIRLAHALRSTPTVWLPGGGYHRDAWKILAGTAMAVSLGSDEPVEDYDVLHESFARTAATLEPRELGASTELTLDDVLVDLGSLASSGGRLMGYYTAEGIAHALERYGITGHLERLGFADIRVTIDRRGKGGRIRVLSGPKADGQLLIECVVERLERDGHHLLYIEWLALQNPKLDSSPDRPLLPGQEHPGLGLAREAGEMLLQMARRLGLAGVGFRPAWYHTAYPVRHTCRFADPARQGRFEAMLRDLRRVPLDEVTRAVADGRVLMNDATYQWEPDLMVSWLDDSQADKTAVAAERDAVTFGLIEPDAVEPDEGEPDDADPIPTDGVGPG
ncbi:MAG: histone deacetylase [Deltaproteobacteria bacterium]|nr:histone deacetylase [Deltaproteobacteria bacterium]